MGRPKLQKNNSGTSFPTTSSSSSGSSSGSSSSSKSGSWQGVLTSFLPHKLSISSSSNSNSTNSSSSNTPATSSSNSLLPPGIKPPVHIASAPETNFESNISVIPSTSPRSYSQNPAQSQSQTQPQPQSQPQSYMQGYFPQQNPYYYPPSQISNNPSNPSNNFYPDQYQEPYYPYPYPPQPSNENTTGIPPAPGNFTMPYPMFPQMNQNFPQGYPPQYWNESNMYNYQQYLMLNQHYNAQMNSQYNSQNQMFPTSQFPNNLPYQNNPYYPMPNQDQIQGSTNFPSTNNFSVPVSNKSSPDQQQQQQQQQQPSVKLENNINLKSSSVDEKLSIEWNNLQDFGDESYQDSILDELISLEHTNSTQSIPFSSLPPQEFEPPKDSQAVLSQKRRNEELLLSGEFDDEDNNEGIKAMRYGSLGRIIANTVAVNDAPINLKYEINQNEEEKISTRKLIITNLFKALQRCDTFLLTKIIKENFNENCYLSTPEIKENISGRGDIMMFYSMILEAFPDGLWTIINIEKKTVTNYNLRYRFYGTKVFNYPLDALFKQIKNHFKSNKHIENGEFLVEGKYIASEVAEHCTSTLTDKISSPVASNSTSSVKKEDLVNSFGEISESEDNSIPRKIQSLREMKSIESVVLKEGPTQYKRVAEITFDNLNLISSIVLIDT